MFLLSNLVTNHDLLNIRFCYEKLVNSTQLYSERLMWQYKAYEIL
jgi:hypothetical protein